MTSLKGLYSNKAEAGDSNFGVDYVIHYKVPPEERTEAEANFVRLIEALSAAGLATEVRHGKNHSLLVLVRIASRDLLSRHVYQARMQDWLHGVRTSGPSQNTTGSDKSSLEQSLRDDPITEAERLRVVYLALTKPRNQGGAGITQPGGQGQWKHVAAVFPLHNHAFNKRWIQGWSKKYLLDQPDLDEIRDRFGESVAFYFAFVQSYFRFLVLPSAAGFASWLFLGQFSSLYAFANCLWSIVFFEHWRHKEVDLAVQWGSRGVSAIQHQRPEFNWDYEAEDPVTGEPVKVYPPTKRLRTQLLQVPFSLACIAVLGGLVLTANSLEIFINEVYNGPFKQYLAFVPTIILVVLTPTFSTILMKGATILTNMENYENIDSYNSALVQKQFVLNFMTSYMPLLFTAFIYIPFGEILVPFLDFWRRTAQVVSFSEKPLPTQDFVVNPARISKQMFYFTVTAQVVNFATETIVPFVKRKAFAKVEELQSKDDTASKDHEEETAFLQRVREECELEEYDVTADYREMVMQYGYLCLFSVAWPLAGCCFLVNNWIEMRSDAVKIAISSKRPIPWRSDSIGPWITALGFLSWLGSITSSAIVFLCSGTQDGERGTTSQITAAGFLLSIFFAEHFYLGAQFAVQFVMGKLESQGLQKERREKYLMKKRVLEESLGQDTSDNAPAAAPEVGEKITRAALEEEARRTSTQGHGTPEELFWQRQRSMQETIIVGQRMIEQSAAEAKPKAGPMPSVKAA